MEKHPKTKSNLNPTGPLSIQLTRLQGIPRLFLSSFLLTLLAGYLTGIYFVNVTTHNTPTGVVEQFRGNEARPLAEVQEIKYPKSNREMLTIIHAHVTSFALIFFAAGVVFYFSAVRPGWKKFLLVEPFAATVILFAGMAGVRYLPTGWAMPLGLIMLLAGVSTFLVLLAMVAISLWEMWRGRPVHWLS